MAKLGGKLPPLCVLLIHLGACSEPIAWAERREISAATLAACPDPSWRSWMAEALKIDKRAPWDDWRRAALAALSGYGSGSGSGYGYGYGYGDGYGDGSGSGDGEDIVT